MLGIADYGAFCAAILLFLALPGPGTFALAHLHRQGRFPRRCRGHAGRHRGRPGAAVAGRGRRRRAAGGAAAAVQGGAIPGRRLPGLDRPEAAVRAAGRRRRPRPHRAAPLRAPGLPDHLAQPQGHRLLHGLLPALHRPRHAPRRRHLCGHGRHHRRHHRRVLPAPVCLCRCRECQGQGQPAAGARARKTGRRLPGRPSASGWARNERSAQSSASPTRRAASARRRPPSTWRPGWRRSAGACCWSTWTRKAMPPWAPASTSARWS